MSLDKAIQDAIDKTERMVLRKVIEIIEENSKKSDIERKIKRLLAAREEAYVQNNS